MKKIFKYDLSLRETQEFDVPGFCYFLSVHKQGDSICLWAMVDDFSVTQTAKIRIVGTGHPCDDVVEARFIGTVVDGSFVWHVFEL